MVEQLLLLSGKTQYAEQAPADGAVIPFSMNQDGRVRVASKPGTWPVSTADLAAVASVLTVDVAEASNVMVHLKNVGTATMSAGTFVFEGSIDSTNGTDGTWFSLQAVRSNANTIETSVTNPALAANAGMAYSWELSVNAVKWFRIRTTVATTASSTARWTCIRGSYATEPVPAIQTHGVTGSVTATPATGTGYALTTAASTNAAVIKSTAGTMYEVSVFNPTAATIYAKFYNKATAPTVGTDVPILVVPVAPNALASMDLGAVGKRFSAGIGIATTAGPASTDAVAIAAGAIISATYI